MVDKRIGGTYEHSGELVKHPVLRRCDALQVLLRSSCLEKTPSRSKTWRTFIFNSPNNDQELQIFFGGKSVLGITTVKDHTGPFGKVR